MRKALTLAALVSMSTVAALSASAADLGYGLLVARVTNTAKSTSRKVFAQAGEDKWALHLMGTTQVFHAGQKVSIHDIDSGTWVKAQGKRIGQLRLEVDRLDIIGDRAAYRKSRPYRRSQPDGYYVAQ